MLYPVELWVRAVATATYHFGDKLLWRQRGYGILYDFDREFSTGLDTQVFARAGKAFKGWQAFAM